MNAEIFWKAYVGEETPAEFMRQHRTDDTHAAALAFASALPNLYGIVLKGNWASSFNQEFQLSREEVAAGLVEHLEATRAEWAEAVADFSVTEENRFTLLRDDQVEAFLGEEIAFKGVEPSPLQNAGIDQLRPFKEMPLPKSSWFDDTITPKVLLNAPTDQEVETKMLQKRSGVSAEVIEKYAAMVGDDDEDETETGASPVPNEN